MSTIDWDSLGFDAYRTRTLILSHYVNGEWSPIKVTEDFFFTLDPFAQMNHYAISCFEGLKAFRQKDGRVAIFRPDQNAARLQRTADYLGMPCPDKEMFFKMCEECIRNNMEFLPPYGHKASMYLRPLLIGVHPQMQLVPYPEAIFAVMCAPVGSYYGEHLKSFAGVVPGNYDRAAPKGSGSYSSGSGSYSTTAKLIEDLATRSGPSTEYTGCGSYKMKGQTVTVLSRAYDKGGVMWVEVEFSYGGGHRRAWTGAKRLNISSSQLAKLPEEDAFSYLGYGTITASVAPRFGPGSIYASYGDRNFYKGDRVVVIAEANGYYKTECYHTDGKILRSWVPTDNVRLD